MDNIILIGFMGVGKGRTARALAQDTGLVAIDTDDLIESMAKKKIRKIFADQGEPVFRGLEQKVADWLNEHVTGTLISTGGGFHQVENLRDIGIVIYLHGRVEYIVEKIMAHPNATKKIKKRPLLSDIKKAKELFDSRLPQYRKSADHIIDVEGKSVAQISSEIIRLLKLERRG
ncbi:shikimate kinase [Desulfogranum marinum]|uniref:shikimate kinase n=1 Tax=Desulfogranum marinum TaxID=453220 RepID=UPI001963EBDC|nr:shikimate kinase [Desulfogranum marinum]MBM9513512.1 shikimate kinase [Desulfogranum marinum]